MIVGLGIDLVEVGRVAKAIHRWGGAFLAGATPHSPTSVPALTLKAAVAAGAPREAGAREFVAYLASDAGLRALAAAAR